MGPDPAEAERWLSMAAERGDQASARLLQEARKAKQDEQTLYQWREANRKAWHGGWYGGYAYYWAWGPAGWALR